MEPIVDIQTLACIIKNGIITLHYLIEKEVVLVNVILRESPLPIEPNCCHDRVVGV